MKFKANTKDFADILSMASAISGRNNTIKMIVEAEDGGVVRLNTNDQSTVCEWMCPAEVEESGTVVFKGGALEKFLKASIKTEKQVMVAKSTDKSSPNNILVRTTKTSHVFETLDNALHPDVEILEIDGPLADLTPFASALKKGLSTIGQMSEMTDSRLCFTGVFVKVEGHEIHVVGTDGVQMTYNAMILEQQKGLSISPEPKGHLIPGSIIPKVVAILNAGPSKATLQNSKLIVANTHGTLSVPLQDTVFPQYKDFLVIKTQHEMILNKNDLTLALQRCAGAISEGIRDPIATLTAKEDGVHLMSNTSEQSSSECVKQGSYDKAEFSFKIHNMTRALANVDSDKVAIRFGNASTPVMVQTPEKNDLILIFMPLKS